MKTYNVFNEYGAYLGSIDAENINQAISNARKQYVLEPIAVQEVKRYGDLVEQNRQLSAHLRDELNNKLSEFYHKTGICINGMEVEFEPIMEHDDDVYYVSNVKLQLNIQ